MGQTSSTSLSTLPELALHCLRVAEHSPADGLIEPFFDYLVGVDEASSVPTTRAGAGPAVPTPAELARIVEANEGRTIGLTVYNAKTQRVRGELSDEGTGGSGCGPGQARSRDSSRCLMSPTCILLPALSSVPSPRPADTPQRSTLPHPAPGRPPPKGRSARRSSASACACATRRRRSTTCGTSSKYSRGLLPRWVEVTLGWTLADQTLDGRPRTLRRLGLRVGRRAPARREQLLRPRRGCKWLACQWPC